MRRIEKIIEQMRANPQNIRFDDLCRVCEHYFGKPRQNKGSHRIYKTHLQSIPNASIQNDNGKAKTYQVKQVIQVIDKLEGE